MSLHSDTISWFRANQSLSNKIVLSGSCVFRATVLSKAAATFVLVLTVSLVSCSTSSVKQLLCKMMKERTILIESCVDDQELLNIVFLLFYIINGVPMFASNNHKLYNYIKMSINHTRTLNITHLKSSNNKKKYHCH
jgi:hypothetical protein